MWKECDCNVRKYVDATREREEAENVVTYINGQTREDEG